MPTDRAGNDWLACPRPNAGASLRLYGFPYAGGGVPMFRAWPESLPPEVELWVIQLPGRGPRIREAPYTRLPLLVAPLAEALGPCLDRPFAFFGYSLGALVAFESIRELRRRGGPLPGHLFVAGRPAPHLPEHGPAIHALPDAAFLDELRRLGGTPVEVLENRELMRLLTPALRADFALGETYAYQAEPPLDCPIAAFGGAQDAWATPRRLEAWRTQTSAGFTLRVFPGDHFFIRTAEADLVQAVSQRLRQLESTEAHRPAP